MAVYGSSLTGGFLYEDAVLPARNVFVRGLVRWSSDLTQLAFGATAFPARVVNLAWHLLNGLLLFLLARQVLTSPAAIFAVALFLLHPIQVESVAYLAARPELIAATWTLLACWNASRGSLLIAAICCGLALTGKETGVMAWLLVPLWAWYTRQTWSERAERLWGSVTLLMVMLFVSAVVQRDFFAVMPWSFYAAQVTAVWSLLWLLPAALWDVTALTIDHDWSWMTRTDVGLVLAGTPVALLVACRLSRVWGCALAWSLLALAPRLLIPLPDGLHERHLYLPMVGLCLALGSLVKR